jgi:hypothetical protein
MAIFKPWIKDMARNCDDDSMELMLAFVTFTRRVTSAPIKGHVTADLIAFEIYHRTGP